MKDQKKRRGLSFLLTVWMVLSLLVSAVPVFALEDGFAPEAAWDSEEPCFVLDPAGERLQNRHPDQISPVKTSFLEEIDFSEDFSAEFVGAEEDDWEVEAIASEEAIDTMEEGFLPASEAADEEFFTDEIVSFSSGAFTYTISSSEAWITDYNIEIGGADVVIPAKLGEYKVTKIDTEAFLDENITSLSFAPDSAVQLIQNGAFKNTNLTSVKLSNTLTYIGEEAFRGAEISTLEIPLPLYSLTIDARAFMHNKLASVTIPKKVNLMGSSIFAENETLTSASFADDYVYLVEGIFENCGLTAFPSGDIHVVEDRALAGNAFTLVTIPDAVEYIGYEAFAECSKLAKVEGGEHVNRLSGSAFDKTPWLNNHADGLVMVGHTVLCWKGGDPGYSDLDFPPAIKAIASFAFDGATWLKSVTFSSELQYIGGMAFYNTGLTSASVYTTTFVDAFAFNFTPTVIPVATTSDFVKEHDYLGGIAVRYIGSQENVTVPSTMLIGATNYEGTR